MDEPATDPATRRTLLVRELMAHRGRQDEVTVRVGDSEPRRLHYQDRQLTLAPSADERERLDELLGEYPVFKLDQPATRKADGTVYVAAVADPKHLADFIEDCCRRVFGLPAGYSLRVE